MHVLSANLCSWGDDELSIKNRMPRMAQTLKKYEPDFICVQECTPEWGRFLSAELTGFNAIGLWRDPKNTGEACLIFYRKDKFTLLSQETFWLSETPDTCSLGWDGRCRRVCTHGRFSDNADGVDFSVFNTHLDHIGHQAQLHGMELVINAINAPAILTGDFNVTEDSEAYKAAAKSLRDVKYAAPKTENCGTWHGFGDIADMTSEKAIDHIFATNGLTPLTYSVLKDTVDGKYISDHYLVAAELLIG